MVQIYCFNIQDTYLFSHYFEQEHIFEELKEYYVEEEYHFEVPAEDLDAVTDLLEDHGFDVKLVDHLEPYTVVKEQYTPYSAILKRSVLHWQRAEHNFFLMQSPDDVAFAVEKGAIPLRETDLVLGL